MAADSEQVIVPSFRGRAWSMCGRYVVKTPIKTIAKMHRVFDAPLFEPRYKTTDTAAVASCQARPRSRCSSVLTRTYPSAFRMAKSSFKWSGGYAAVPRLQGVAGHESTPTFRNLSFETVIISFQIQAAPWFVICQNGSRPICPTFINPHPVWPQLLRTSVRKMGEGSRPPAPTQLRRGGATWSLHP